MDYKTEPTKSFKKYYKANLIGIGLVYFLAIFFAVFMDDFFASVFFMLMVFHFIFASPLLMSFGVMNIYGVIKFDDPNSMYLFWSITSFLLIVVSMLLFFIMFSALDGWYAT